MVGTGSRKLIHITRDKRSRRRRLPIESSACSIRPRLDIAVVRDSFACNEAIQRIVGVIATVAVQVAPQTIIFLPQCHRSRANSEADNLAVGSKICQVEIAGPPWEHECRRVELSSV